MVTDSAEKTSLEKNLGVFSLTVFGVGIIVGAGVYSVLGAAAGHAGSSLWLSFILAAAIAILTAFSYCELTTMFPAAGAEFVYLRKTFPDKQLPAFLMGFLLILAGAATAATVAYGFAGYLQYFIEGSKTFIAFILVVLITFINCLGMKHSSRVNLIFTFIEVAGLLVIIWLGFGHAPVAIDTSEFKISSGTIAATTLIFFVYLGFEDIANLSEETKNPEKNIPRAYFWSLGITTILYIAVAIAVMRLAPPEVLSASNLPLAEAVKNVAPAWVRNLSYIALCSTFNTALITMLAVARMIYGIAQEGYLPKVLAKKSARNKTPIAASLFVLVACTFFLLVGELEVLANVSSFTALLGFLTVNLVLIILRFKRPELKRPFRIPLNVGKLPVIPVLNLLLILALCTQFQGVVYLITFLMLTSGILVFYITKKFKKA